MKFAWSIAVLGLALAAGVQDDFKKIVSDVEGVKRSSRKVSKEGREKIEKAIERKLDDKELAVQIWEGRAMVPEANQSEKVRVLYTVVAAKGPKGEFKVAVAIAPEERVLAGVRVVENKDDPAIASDDFLGQFEPFKYTPNVWNPGSALEEARKSAMPRKDERSKQIDGIFKLFAIMHQVDRSWKSLQGHLDGDGKAAADDSDRLAKLFSDTDALVGDFSFMKTSSADTFRRRLKDSSAKLREITQFAKAGKLVEALAAATETYNMSCKLCHAGNERIFRDKRSELGIGNGYFAPDHDVKQGVAPRDSVDAAAKAIRLAVLILSEAR
jgi:hypothetical protein